MLNTLALLLLYQLGGELVARFFGLPIPGPVIGMTLLLLTLLARGEVSHDTRTNVGAFLQHMSLFFVPAGVGVMAVTLMYFARGASGFSSRASSAPASTLP